MANLSGTTCCGLSELANIQGNKDPLSILLDIAPKVMQAKRSFLVYSCNDQGDIGDELSLFIKDMGLGTVKRTRQKLNPNSGNKLRVYLWDVNADGLSSWYVKNKPFEYSVGDRVRVVGVTNTLNAHIEGQEGTVIASVGSNVRVAFRKVMTWTSSSGNEAKHREFQFSTSQLEFIPV